MNIFGYSSPQEAEAGRRAHEKMLLDSRTTKWKPTVILSLTAATLSSIVAILVFAICTTEARTWASMGVIWAPIVGIFTYRDTLILWIMAATIAGVRKCGTQLPSVTSKELASACSTWFLLLNLSAEE
jgi:hypothetical protein